VLQVSQHWGIRCFAAIVTGLALFSCGRACCESDAGGPAAAAMRLGCIEVHFLFVAALVPLSLVLNR
jgi:hypothetical protein